MARGRAGPPSCALNVSPAEMRWSIGRPKPSVLPDPVLALPQTSRPASASLIVRAWIGKAVDIPCAESTATNSGSTPNSAKVLLVAYESCADGTDSLISLLTGQRRFSVGPGTGVRRGGPSSIPRASLPVYDIMLHFRTAS